jgi:P4 family phage/plasmid primase-like protien
MIHVIALRPDEDLKQKTFGIIGSSVEGLFANIDSVIEKIPEDERYNCHYTLSHSETDNIREFSWQDILPIDIDKVADEHRVLVATSVCATLHLPIDKVGIVFSGHGVHVLIKLPFRITERDYFTKFRSYYKNMADLIDRDLREKGLTGNVDCNLFAPSHLLRLPNTENRKEGLPNCMSVLYCAMMEEQPFDLTAFKPQIEDVRRITQRTLIQREGVITCPFLEWVRTHPHDVSEPQWHGAIGILAWIPEVGEQLCHEYSKEHSTYSYNQTEAYIARAKDLTGPRTCNNIEGLFDGCIDCPIRKSDSRVTTPLVIKTSDYIQTQDSGFHFVVESKSGIKRTPDYEGLARYFKQKYNAITNAQTNNTYIWQEGDFTAFETEFRGGYWHMINRNHLEKFALQHFNPYVKDQGRKEFARLVEISNNRNGSFFDTQEGYINFNNGVLDVAKMEIIPNSLEWGFTYKLPFDFDPTATCPKYDQFIEEVLNEKEAAMIVNEYMAYAAASMPNSLYEKALLLLGGGSNGKSVLMNTMRHIFGNDNCCSVGMGAMQSENSRPMLINKLINIVPEENKKALLNNSDLFKMLVSGEELTAKILYKDQFTFCPKAKLVFSYNELPFSNDHSNGFYRRFIVLSFPNSYIGKENRNLTNELKLEASGIWNRIIEAYKRLLENKAFTVSNMALNELSEFKSNSDSFMQFIEEFVQIKDGLFFHQDDFTLMRDAYQVYARISKESGQIALGYQQFVGQFKKILHKDRVKRKRVGDATNCLIVVGIKVAGLQNF